MMTGIISAGPAKKTLEEFLVRGKERARQTGESVLVSLSRPLTYDTGFLSLFASCKQSGLLRIFWGRPDKDFWLVGRGSAAGLNFNGATSMDKAAYQYHSLLKSALIDAPDIPGVGPLALGGFRYDLDTPKDAEWRSFPDASLVVPRFLFTRSGKSTWLTINTIVKPETDVIQHAIALLAELQPVSAPDDYPQPVISSAEQSPPEEYACYVRRALEEIEGGQLAKVVLARRKVLHADGPFSLDNALEQLCRNYPDCAVFAFENGESAFFGATPESLVRIEQGKLSLTCLAGSSSRGNNREEDLELEKQLHESQKERREHSAVVAMVTASLKDLCRELQWDGEPRVLKLKNVQHLLTSVSGSLNHGTSILEVVKRLHPTPAVAGVPTGQAMSFIRNAEGDRGWYAAPVGWLDHTGGGEFAVGIRSALLNGNRAVLYAGAGIVKGSDPFQEFQETELKFQPLMAALSSRS